ncbi:MAG: FAD-binding protein, partial [Xenococcus sp. MO_188.B8]|nr:FAD-binding protein [Xenococcus sp. MO_188.B8]
MLTVKMTKAIATQLESLINTDTELIAFSKAASYWQDKIGKTVIDSTDSIYLIFPQSINSLADIVKEAHQHKWRILICGNGSKLDWGGLTKDIQLVVSTQKCASIIEHAVGDLT